MIEMIPAPKKTRIAAYRTKFLRIIKYPHSSPVDGNAQTPNRFLIHINIDYAALQSVIIVALSHDIDPLP